MEDTYVHVFLDNLRQLMNSDHHESIAGKKAEIACLHGNIEYMSNFLKETEEKRFKDRQVNDLVKKMRDVVFDAETIIDLFLIDALAEEIGGAGGEGCDLSANLDGVNKEIEAIRKMVEQMNNDAKLGTSSILDFQEETIGNIIESFHDDAVKPLNIISIVGMPGVGKTTLAKKLYHDTRTREAFQVQAWVAVGSQHEMSGLLLKILGSSSVLLEHSTVDMLGEELYRRLKDKKYLIVVDDLWSVEAWHGIRRFLPLQPNGSTVIITTRNRVVGKEASYDESAASIIHDLQPLSDKQSWELLKNKVFANQNSCPHELETLGKRIAEKCYGLPVAIVVIGGVLANKDKTPEWWKKVADSLKPVELIQGLYNDIMEHGYMNLPLHLKACFLYLGMFPEDYEIPLRNLVWMMIADGFITHHQQSHQTDKEKKSLEVIAQGYINELVDRNLLMIARKRSDGSTKTCYIHDTLRDWSIMKGKEDNFFTYIPANTSYGVSPSYLLAGDTNKRCRRLCMDRQAYLNVSPAQLYPRHLRSLLVCSSGSDKDLSAPPEAFNEDDFKLLKVLDLSSINMPSFPSKIGDLFHLKYLALCSEVADLPQSSFTDLVNLETLILQSREETVILPHDIWKMVKLRHLINTGGGVFHFETLSEKQAKISYSPRKSFSTIIGKKMVKMKHLLKKKQPLDSGKEPVVKHSSSYSNSVVQTLENLQTINRLCSCTSCIEMLMRTPKITKLGLCGDLVSDTIPALHLFMQLEALKLINRSPYHRNGLVDSFTLKLPSCLNRLTLQNTFLKWEEISALGSLENLQVLKLLDNACVGSVWNTCDQEFPQLKYLKLQNVDIIKWVDNDMQFPSLNILVLDHCPNIEILPSGLAQLPRLGLMEVNRCKDTLEKSARNIAQSRKQRFGDENLKTVILSQI